MDFIDALNQLQSNDTDYLGQVEGSYNEALATAIDAVNARYDAERSSLKDALGILRSTFKRSRNQYRRARGQAFEQVDDNALSRGILRSGVRERTRAEAAAPIAEAIAALSEAYGQQRRDVRGTMNTIGARRRAERAAVTDQVNQQYLSVAQALANLGLLTPRPADGGDVVGQWDGTGNLGPVPTPLPSAPTATNPPDGLTAIKEPTTYTPPPTWGTPPTYTRTTKSGDGSKERSWYDSVVRDNRWRTTTSISPR